MKVLLIAFNNLGKGGIQNQLIGILRALKDRVDFDVVIWDNKRDYYRAEVEESARIIECFRDTGKTKLRQKADAFIRYQDIRKRIDRIIKEYGPYDAIHCNNAFDAAPCLHAAYDNHIPVRISHAHNTENPALSKKLVYPAYRFLYEQQRKRIRKYATHRIGCSRQVCDYFFGENQGDVVHIGIDLSQFKDIHRTTSTASEFQILQVGNFSQQKNQLFSLDVLHQLTQIRPDVHLTFIGSGNAYLEQMKKKIANYSLSDYISILPPETNIPTAMASADLFLFPSSFEGFGIVLIEAQSVGLNCFVSEVVTQEANCGGLTTLQLEAGPEHWAEAINSYINEHHNNTKEYDVSEFSVEKMGERIYQLYRS